MYRSKDDGTFNLIATTDLNSIELTSYIDYGLKEGQYDYKVICTNVDGDSDDSNTESVTVDLSGNGDLPENPSIKINDGDETTDSFRVTLTLSCENAEYMSFRVSIGGELEDWTNPESFDFYKSLTLPDASNYTIYTITVYR